METLYSPKFYANQQAGSLSSAEVVIPIVLSLFKVNSAVDIGCGVGGWLKTLSQYGVSDFQGLDGDYVSAEMLQIPAENFTPTDLSRSFSLPRKYDLAISLEVAEHLPESSADEFVESIVNAAPVVLFSAAIPLQGGLNHINEQWQSYWASKFARHGYVAIDCIRPAIFRDPRVASWYRQNILIFCEPAKVPPSLSPVTSAYQLDRVDHGLLAYFQGGSSQPGSGKEALQSIMQAVPVLINAALKKVRLA